MQVGAINPVVASPAAFPRPAATAPRSADGQEPRPPGSAPPQDSGQLDEEERAQVQSLKARDQEVRAHEAAHMAAAGGLARGGASYGYETGPDGQRYAVSGEVSIDTSPGRDAEETIRKAETIRAAALAPAKPSQQDLAVAASATQMAAEARAELATKTADSRYGEDGTARPSAAVESYARVDALGGPADDGNRIDLAI